MLGVHSTVLKYTLGDYPIFATIMLIYFTCEKKNQTAPLSLPGYEKAEYVYVKACRISWILGTQFFPPTITNVHYGFKKKDKRI